MAAMVRRGRGNFGYTTETVLKSQMQSFRRLSPYILLDPQIIFCHRRSDHPGVRPQMLALN